MWHERIGIILTICRSHFSLISFIQSYPCKEWDCEDDIKNLKKVNLSFLSLILSFNGFLNDLTKKERSLHLQGIMNVMNQTV